MIYHSKALFVLETNEFAHFTKGAQRFITRSLYVADYVSRADIYVSQTDIEEEDPIKIFARDHNEAEYIKRQQDVYSKIPYMVIPDNSNTWLLMDFMGQLIYLTESDLFEEKLSTFSEYKFLYERLFGVSIRPLLPSAFCGASSMPTLRPDYREKLLCSISITEITATRWSDRSPVFFPTWVDKVPKKENL